MKASLQHPFGKTGVSNRYADTAAVFQALGGGWWNRPDIPKN
ncbi:MAG TPA: hypothetical protein VMU53_11170 [Candidatus Sulfotelmatobacter sp.]|nr:hypothetical protein [Candidatus Sulfotelmatobacter sp.]